MLPILASGDIYYIGSSSDIALSSGLLGIVISIALILLAYKMDGEEKKNIWKPILFFIDVPILLATGISFLGYNWFSVEWWIGIMMFSFAIIIGFGGLYYGLHYGQKN